MEVYAYESNEKCVGHTEHAKRKDEINDMLNVKRSL